MALIKLLGKTNIQGKTIFATDQSPTYTITRSASSVDEGSSITFTLSTTNVANGTTLPYTISGISANDVTSGTLTGNFTVNNGSATTTITMSADQLTEGAETATLTLNNGAASNFVVVNDTSLTFLPTSISGLQLWLDASDTSTLYDATAGGSLVTTNGSTVARWQDKSGYGRHFTQSVVNSRPILNTNNQNNKNVVYFDSDFMTGSVTGFRSLGSTTIIAVTKPLSAATQDVYTMAVWSHGQQGQNRYLAVQGSSTNLTGETIVVNIQAANARQLGSSTYTRAANTAQILTSTFSTGGTKLYANSSEVSLNLYAAGASTTANSSPSAVGWSDDIIRLNGYHTSATIAGPKNRVCEFLIYDSVLTAQQRTDVWNYLSTKWAI